MSMVEVKRISEVINLKFDYADEIGAAAIQTAIVTPTVIEGSDPAVGAMLQGPYQILGPLVLQLCKNGVDGVTYEGQCLATLSDGRKLFRYVQFRAKAP